MSKTDKDARKRGIKELIGGVVVAAAGGVASFASYNMAKAGETYTVYTGIIVLGIAYAIKGVIDIAFPKGFSKKSADQPTELAANTEEVVVKEEED